MKDDELVAHCDLCKEPLDAMLSVEIWKWALHPKCAAIVRERLERFASVVFDMTDEEFEAGLQQDEEQGEWHRPTGPPLEYEVDDESHS